MDKILGGLYGVFIGDALGAPHEFRNITPKTEYTGLLLDIPVTINFRFTSLTLQPGSVTDDSEMTIQLLKSILENKGYDEDKTIKKYLEWANMKNTPLGKNTRNLMKGVTTVRGFRNRQDKTDTSGVESNGSLMRCFPLVLLKDWKKASAKDVNLTNDNPVNRECSIIYLRIARHLIYGDKLKFKFKQESIKSAVASALKNEIIDVSHNKGWVVHALYVALITLFNATSFESGMSFIHKHFFDRTDTDTIMCISAGLLGAKYGYESISTEITTSQNIEKVNRYFENTSRPAFTEQLKESLIKLHLNHY